MYKSFSVFFFCVCLPQTLLFLFFFFLAFGHRSGRDFLRGCTFVTQCVHSLGPLRAVVALDFFYAVQHAQYTTLDKKEPSPRFAARRTLFHHVISCSITHDQRRTRVADDLALIARDQAWYHRIEQCSFRRESQGWFFFFIKGCTCLNQEVNFLLSFHFRSLKFWCFCLSIQGDEKKVIADIISSTMSFLYALLDLRCIPYLQKVCIYIQMHSCACHLKQRVEKDARGRGVVESWLMWWCIAGASSVALSHQ